MLIRLRFYVNWINLFWKQSALLLRRILENFGADGRLGELVYHVESLR